jgi:glutamyl-tRNA reductase
MFETANIFVLGINHHTAPMEIRERFTFSKSENKEFIQMLKRNIVPECFLLSTCNRTEVYGVATSLSDINKVFNMLLAYKSIDDESAKEFFFKNNNAFAINHFFELAAGLNSAVLGDIQILNQIREQFSIAREVKAAGKAMHQLMQSANIIGERVRRETEISKGAVSVSYAAVELALRNFRQPESASVLIIGAGETGGQTAKHFSLRGMKNVYVANRTKAKADEVAKFYNGKTMAWENIGEALTDIEVVISSVAADQYVLKPEDFATLQKKILVVDISMPRSIDPAISLLTHVEYYDLDSLTRIVEQTLPQRRTEIPKVKGIIAHELNILNERWNNSNVPGQFKAHHFTDSRQWIKFHESVAVC